MKTEAKREEVEATEVKVLEEKHQLNRCKDIGLKTEAKTEEVEATEVKVLRVKNCLYRARQLEKRQVNITETERDSPDKSCMKIKDS